MRVLSMLIVAAVCPSCLLQPNIITIIADDLGWNDVGFHGSNQIPTPNIDALAYNGVILNRHYTLPTCTPSRTAYLTGRYPIRTGMQSFPLRGGEPRGLPLQEVTLPQRLRELGYVTRMIGKWHQGSHRTEFAPTQRGFDSFLGYWNGFISYFDYTMIEDGIGGLDFHRDNCSTSEYVGRYATDVFTDEAVDIINSHDPVRPLYLHIAHLAVHAGNPTRRLEVPDPEETHRRFSYIDTPERRLYAGMVSKLDESVGRVVTALSERGVLNNTILVFMSDNGAQTFGLHQNTGSNWPLRGLKFTLFEGGVRGLAAVWSPMLNNPGRVTNQLVHISDWLPTLYSAAGGNVSDLGLLDGIDQWASLTSRQGTMRDPRKQILLNIDQAQDTEAAISRMWKITRGDYNNGVYDGYFGDDGRGTENPVYNMTEILNSEVNRALKKFSYGARNSKGVYLDKTLINNLRSQLSIACASNLTKRKYSSSISCKKYCLFDLINDPCETIDLASNYPEKVEEISAVISKYRHVVVPELNKPVDPASFPALHGGAWVSWLDDSPAVLDECALKLTSTLANSSGSFFNTFLLLVVVFLVNQIIIIGLGGPK